MNVYKFELNKYMSGREVKIAYDDVVEKKINLTDTEINIIITSGEVIKNFDDFLIDDYLYVKIYCLSQDEDTIIYKFCITRTNATISEHKIILQYCEPNEISISDMEYSNKFFATGLSTSDITLIIFDMDMNLIDGYVVEWDLKTKMTVK